ncbi:uncharacterized protein Dwil_GK23955 [Drosophila willistoni]|uniref:Zinc carboxypeptidase A 1 n=1 Tax=Drosophila willistoni TaxID=7260 RepID=B4MU23_DROWI|nr:zinc carboxypeptidase [Drosophila willistoni]EDW75612.1 uncharacterized protein Dwil_GK23955 [Drosophila willistoni]
MRLVGLLLPLVLLALVSAGTVKDTPKKRFDNYKVYQLIIKNKIQLAAINKLSELSEKFNIWKEYDERTKQIDIMVQPEELSHFHEILKLNNIHSELVVPNVQTLIDEEQQQVTPQDNVSFGWTKYYELEEIQAWLDEILATYPEVTKEFIVGQSYEGRTIRGITISHGTDKPGIFIESNIHAREWITSASATWFINQLLTSQDPDVRNLADSYDWHIVPVFNVDGFDYSHKKDRMWRKTRQPHSTNACIGADANRNFDSYWLQNGGSSDNPCSETFAGDVPNSEPEAKALVEYLTAHQDEFKVYLSFHSYGLWLLSPYGHTADPLEKPENADDLLEIGEAFTAAVKALPYATDYVHGPTGTTLYVASGTSVDWVFNELNKEVAFTLEFRDKTGGSYGFILPPVQIIPNCEELMAGMLALIGKTKDLGYL